MLVRRFKKMVRKFKKFKNILVKNFKDVHNEFLRCSSAFKKFVVCLREIFVRSLYQTHGKNLWVNSKKFVGNL